MRWKTPIAFLVGLVVGFAVSVGAQQALDAYRASTIKRSASDAVAVSRALESYKRDHGKYPDVSRGSPYLADALTPKYLRTVPKNTYSGRPYIVLPTAPTPAVVALGRGGFIVQSGHVAFFQPYRSGDEMGDGRPANGDR